MVRFSPAHISFAHTSSEITRGSGPISALIERGSANARRGSNRRSIHSHSCRSRKNVRSDQIRCALERGDSGPPRAGAHVVGVQRLRELADQHPVDRARSTRRRAARSHERRVGPVGMLALQPPAGLDQRVVGVRRGSSDTASRSQNHRCVQSSHTAGTSISPAWLRASHSSRDGCVANGSRSARPSRPAFARAAPRRDRRALFCSRERNATNKSRPGAEVLEQRAAGEQHQFIQRVLSIGRPSTAAMPSPSMCACTRPTAASTSLGVEHAARELPALNPRSSRCRSR